MTSTTRTDRLQALSEANAAFDPKSWSGYGGRNEFGSPTLPAACRLAEDSDDAASPQKKPKATKKSKASKLKAKGVLSPN